MLNQESILANNITGKETVWLICKELFPIIKLKTPWKNMKTVHRKEIQKAVKYEKDGQLYSGEGKCTLKPHFFFFFLPIILTQVREISNRFCNEAVRKQGYCISGRRLGCHNPVESSVAVPIQTEKECPLDTARCTWKCILPRTPAQMQKYTSLCLFGILKSWGKVNIPS